MRKNICANWFQDLNIYMRIKFYIETYKNNEIPNELKGINAVKPGSRNFSK